MTTAGGDILSIDYMVLGSIQSFSDEEIFSESKDAFMSSKAKLLPIGSLSSCSLQPLVKCGYQSLTYTQRG